MVFLRLLAVTALLSSFSFGEICADKGAIPEASKSSNHELVSVPESSTAIFVGSLLWFLLLRKRA